MDPSARRAQARLTLRRCFHAWTILATLAATIGAVISWANLDNDSAS